MGRASTRPDRWRELRRARARLESVLRCRLDAIEKCTALHPARDRALIADVDRTIAAIDAGEQSGVPR